MAERILRQYKRKGTGFIMATEGKRKVLRDEFKGAVPLTGTEAETFKWDRIGKRLQGRLVRIFTGNLGGKIALIDTGKAVETVACPLQLADALSSIKQGTKVVIEYLSESPSRDNPDNKVKRFDVVALPE